MLRPPVPGRNGFPRSWRVRLIGGVLVLLTKYDRDGLSLDQASLEDKCTSACIERATRRISWDLTEAR
jgi:hypothetical protein